MADEARERAFRVQEEARRNFMAEFRPPRDEFTSVDLLIRQGEDGGVRAYPTLTVNGQPLALSRAGWEMILPRLLQYIYGGRIAEAEIHQAAAEAREAWATEEEAAQAIQQAMIRHGNTVVAAHPLEMRPTTEEALRQRPTTLAQRRERTAAELKARLRRNKEDKE